MKRCEADRARFEGNEVVRAMRILGSVNELTLLRVFAYQLDDDLPHVRRWQQRGLGSAQVAA